MTRTQAEDLLLRFRECLRKYAGENAITLSLLAVVCIITWAWIFAVGVLF